MAPTILAAIASLSLFVFILWLLRKGVLKEKYAVLWLLVTASALVFTIFPNALRWISDQLGVEIPSALYVAVAQVLTYVTQLTQARRVGAPPPPAPSIDPAVEELGRRTQG